MYFFSPKISNDLKYKLLFIGRIIAYNRSGALLGSVNEYSDMLPSYCWERSGPSCQKPEQFFVLS